MHIILVQHQLPSQHKHRTINSRGEREKRERRERDEREKRERREKEERKKREEREREESEREREREPYRKWPGNRNLVGIPNLPIHQMPSRLQCAIVYNQPEVRRHPK
jgi:hypothetical protein